MFDHRHYFPVLRWKGAERHALCKLDPTAKSHITPVIEFIPREFEQGQLTPLLGNKAKEIAENWGWNDLIFVDFGLLGDRRAGQSIIPFAAAAARYQIKAGFVIGLHPTAEYLSAMRTALQTNNREICLRINGHELRQAGVQRAIHNLLLRLGKNPSTVHLIVDFQVIADSPPSIAASLSVIPTLNDWRSLAIIGGAFPKDLSHLEKNQQYLLPRIDWITWLDYAASATGRVASYGDYTIQHGAFEEREGKNFNFSASIRYSTNESWVIMRGEGVLNEDGPGYAQWPAWAQLLCEREEFCGPQFSFGDGYIHAMSQQVTKTGTAKNWLAAGFNHHLTFVAQQIQDPFATANSAGSSLVQSPSLHFE